MKTMKAIIPAVIFAVALTACVSGRTAALQNPASSAATSAGASLETKAPGEREQAELAVSFVSKSAESEVRSKPKKVMPDISGSPALSTDAVEITSELMKELRNRIQTTHKAGVDAPGAMGEFIEANPNFLFNQARRVLISKRGEDGSSVVDDGGEHALLLWSGAAPPDDLLGRTRLAKFVRNYKAGVPDRIAVVSAGAPISVEVEVFTYEGNGTAYTVESYGDDLKKPRVARLDKLVQTDREWLMINQPDWKIRYPKYGYEPIPLSNSGKKVSQVQAQREVAAYIEERYADTAYTVSALEKQTIGGKPCYVFEASDKSDRFSSETFAVSTNLDRLYEREQVNGQWMLHARPKSAPIKA